MDNRREGAEGMSKVTLWYQHEPGEYGCDPMYNHLEHGWNTQDTQTLYSSFYCSTNVAVVKLPLAYLENGVVTIDKWDCWWYHKG